MHLRYLSCQGHLDRVLMAAPTRRFPDPCQDQKSASVRLATRVETYFFTSSAFTTTIPPPPTGQQIEKTHTHKNRCFFFIPAPKDRPGQPRTLLGCNHAHQVALAAPQELPVPYQVQWIRPACLPNLRFWEGKEVEKAEIKWTPVVWHSWLENHPGPFLPTPICNKTSSCFKRMHRMKQPGLDGVELSRVEGWLESILRKHEGSRSTSCCFPWNGFKSSEICDCKIWSSFWFYINVQHFESYMTLPYPISIRPF